jgi:hypothetical protein
MLFPRGFVGASSFWNFNASVDSQAPAFVDAVWALNDQVVAAGGYTCPTRCDCDLLSACNVPYLPMPPPEAGFALSTAACQLPLPPLQSYFLLPANGSAGAGEVLLATPGGGGALLCAAFAPGHAPTDMFGPLVLAPCAGGGPLVVFAPRSSEAGDGHLVVADSLQPPDEPACLDAGAGLNGTVSASECGSHNGFLQANQGWAVDGAAGILVSFAGGGCLTAVPQ